MTSAMKKTFVLNKITKKVNLRSLSPSPEGALKAMLPCITDIGSPDISESRIIGGAFIDDEALTRETPCPEGLKTVTPLTTPGIFFGSKSTNNSALIQFHR